MKYSKETIVFCMVLIFTSQAFSLELVQSKDGADTSTDYISDYYVGVVCLTDEFRCISEECIPITQRCNGNNDCPDPDDSDEVNCTFASTTDAVSPIISTTATVPPTTFTTTSVLSTTFPEYEGCEENEFECDDGFVCLSNKQVCDGLADCTDFTDEMECPSETTTVANTTPTSITSARPFTEGPKCLYEDVYYSADTQIIITNCSEVICSSSGHIVTWENDDPACSGYTMKPTLSMPYLILTSVLISWLR